MDEWILGNSGVVLSRLTKMADMVADCFLFSWNRSLRNII